MIPLPMKILSSFLLFMAFTSPAFAQVAETGDAEPKVDLHLNLQAGEQYLYSVGINQQIVQEVMGQSITIDQRMNTDYAYKILSNDGNLIKIEVAYKRIQMDFDLPQNKFEYNSEIPGMGNLAALDGLIDKPFVIFMTPQGSAKKVEGYTEVIDGLELTDEIKGMLSDSSLLQSLDMNIYAGRPVGMGESWNTSKTMNISPIVLTSDLTYTLEGSSEDLAWINVDGEVSAVSKEAEYDLELSGKQEGTIETDIKTGMVSSGRIDMDIEAKLIAQGFEIPMTMKMEISISGKKL